MERTAPVSYSLAELERASGISRRNIAYYIQQGLLPKVGRRGPGTRYPETFLHRLRFITEIRDLQQRGHLQTIALQAIARLLQSLDDPTLRQLLRAGMHPDSLQSLFAGQASSPPAAAPPTAAPGPAPPGTGVDGRRYGLADAAIRSLPGAAAVRTPATVAPPSPEAPADGGGSLAELGELLRELELQSTLNRQRGAAGAAEQWTQIPLTSRVYLNIRGLAAEQAPLAEAAARLLKGALRSR